MQESFEYFITYKKKIIITTDSYCKSTVTFVYKYGLYWLSLLNKDIFNITIENLLIVASGFHNALNEVFGGAVLPLSGITNRTTILRLS